MNNHSHTGLQLLGFFLIVMTLLGCTQSVYVYEGEKDESKGFESTDETMVYGGEVIPKEEQKPASDRKVISDQGRINATERKPAEVKAPPPFISAQDRNRLFNRIREGVLPGWMVEETRQHKDLVGQVDVMPPCRFSLRDGKQHFCDILIYPKTFQNLVLPKGKVLYLEYLGTDGKFAYYCYPQYKGSSNAVQYLKRMLKLSPA